MFPIMPVDFSFKLKKSSSTSLSSSSSSRKNFSRQSSENYLSILKKKFRASTSNGTNQNSSSQNILEKGAGRSSYHILS